MNLIDALDEAIRKALPGVALAREKAKLKLGALSEINKRGYEGASKSRRTEGWKAGDTSAQTESLSALKDLRARSRDLCRNNGYVKKGINGIVANAIGTGIIAQAKHKTSSKAEKANAQWRAWADSPMCDFDGMHDFSGLQALCLRSVLESGEVIIRRRFVKPSAEFPNRVPLELQILESDFLDITKNIKPSKEQNEVIQGVEFDAQGKRVAYWLFTSHPAGASNLKSVRVEADEVIHLFRIERPGQVRGIPATAPIIIKSRDLDEYEDAELIRRKIAACFTAFLYDSEAPEAGGKNPPLLEKFEPGAIEILPPGKDIKFSEPPTVTGYSEYIIQTLRKISAGLEVPYEVLTGDYSQVNFSSGRMGWIEFQRTIDMWRWQVFVPRLCNRVWNWFVVASELAKGGGVAADVTAEWTPPRREMIDPVKETKALNLAVRSGFKSLAEAIREQGYDPDAVLAEIEKNNATLDQKKLVLDSDPRKTALTGKFQDTDAEGSAPDA